MSRVKSYGPNLVGRDFVCGDIHGHYDKLVVELEIIQFDYTKDRLFSLGDLIDRGPKSYEVLKLIEESWFFPILGNHELLALWSFYVEEGEHPCPQDFTKIDRSWFDVWRHNGYAWFFDATLTNVERQHAIRLMWDLPLMIDVQVGNKTIGLVHASSSLNLWATTVEDQQFPSWEKTVKYIQDNIDDADMGAWQMDPVVQNLVWDRDSYDMISYGMKLKIVPDIDHVYLGHSIVDSPITSGNTTLLDTGPNKPTGKITIVNLTELYGQSN